MTTTYEFGSPGWLQATCDIVKDKLLGSGIDLSGVDYTMGEEFFNVPDRLNPSGAERTGWTVMIRNGVIETATVPPSADYDSNNIADWEAIEHLAHHVFGADPERDAEVGADVAKLTADGKLEMVVRRERPAAMAKAMGDIHVVHNAVVAVTGPRQA